VRSASSEVHISKFAGQRVAIDASSWLHRGAFSCARELALGQETDRYLRFPLRMIAMLRSHCVEPVLVFDGAKLPMKVRTDRLRSAARSAALQRAHREQRDKDFTDSITVTPAMADRLLRKLRESDTAFVVAPYEADAQMVFLVEHGHCAAAITEDSDLLAFRCPRTIYKLSPETGYCRLHSFDDLCHATDSSGSLLFDDWQSWKTGLFTDMCILSGCDYLPSIPGVGLKTAHAALSTHRSMQRAISALHDKFIWSKAQSADPAGRAELLQLTSEHLELCTMCQQIFKYATVWDPVSAALVPLHQLGTSLDIRDRDRLGPLMAPSDAKLLCEDGVLDPTSLQLYPTVEQSMASMPKREDVRSRFFDAVCPRVNTAACEPSSISIVQQNVVRRETAESALPLNEGAVAPCETDTFLYSAGVRSPMHFKAFHVPLSDEAKTAAFESAHLFAIDSPPCLGDAFLQRFRGI